MDRLVECVPNFSEGRNEETLRTLVAAVTAVPDVVLLDQERDWDHHRAVLTFIGTPEAVAEAAVVAARVAAARIDLRQHQGGHPRVGATDVIPFVPIRGVTMKDCVGLARRVGERIGTELGIPIFLYERAATRSERVQLENIRRGGLEGLGARMREPAWRPDFGPPALHPSAGATIVGARPPLIAYNINLQTTDLDAAKAIAKKIRHSSGGLPFVKAIGVELASRRLVQVSMNLTNHEETPIHVVFEAVREEAARRNIRLAGSEVIGLVPQGALTRAAEFFLKLEGFDHSQVLETRLEAALARAARVSHDSSIEQGDVVSSLRPFFEAVSAGSPTPGGGSVAALAGALACSLGLMACRIGPPAQSRRPDSSTDEPKAESLHVIERRLVELQQRLQALIRADAEAYETVLQAYRMPKTDPARGEAISNGLQMATRVPLETAELSCEAATLLHSLLLGTKPSVESDIRVGVLMASAAIEGGLINVQENIKSQLNQQFKSSYGDKVKALKQKLVDIRKL